MKNTTELTIRGDRANLEHLLVRVEALLRDGWKRDREAEAQRSRHGALEPCPSCFSCTARADRPAAAFWVHARSPNEWVVSHVIPLERQSLTEEETRRLLAEFERDFLGPTAAEVGVETEIVEHRQSPEDDLSPEAVRLLRSFSASANRPSLNPDDRRRWNAFLVQMHRDESLFDPALLDEWLQQEGWPQVTRHQLVAEYETARSLLLAYDEEAERR